MSIYLYTTQLVKSTFSRTLASSEEISEVLFTSEQPKGNKMAFGGMLSQLLVTLWSASHSGYVVHIKTIVHLSVGESGGYLFIHLFIYLFPATCIYRRLQ